MNTWEDPKQNTQAPPKKSQSLEPQTVTFKSVDQLKIWSIFGDFIDIYSWM